MSKTNFERVGERRGEGGKMTEEEKRVLCATKRKWGVVARDLRVAAKRAEFYAEMDLADIVEAQALDELDKACVHFLRFFPRKGGKVTVFERLIQSKTPEEFVKFCFSFGENYLGATFKPTKRNEKDTRMWIKSMKEEATI